MGGKVNRGGYAAHVDVALAIGKERAFFVAAATDTGGIDERTGITQFGQEQIVIAPAIVGLDGIDHREVGRTGLPHQIETDSDIRKTEPGFVTAAPEVGGEDELSAGVKFRGEHVTVTAAVGVLRGVTHRVIGGTGHSGDVHVAA